MTTRDLRDPATLLGAWEACARVPDVVRGAAVLEALDGQGALDRSLAAVGASLVHRHVETFGDVVDGLLTCPACALAVEVAVSLPDLLEGTDAPHGPARVDTAGGPVEVRAPSPRDLLAVAGCDDPRTTLLRRCARRADGGAPVSPGSVDDAELAELDAALERLAGAGLVRLRARCPDCGADVEGALDVGCQRSPEGKEEARLLG